MRFEEITPFIILLSVFNRWRTWAAYANALSSLLYLQMTRHLQYCSFVLSPAPILSLNFPLGRALFYIMKNQFGLHLFLMSLCSFFFPVPDVLFHDLALLLSILRFANPLVLAIVSLAIACDDVWIDGLYLRWMVFTLWAPGASKQGGVEIIDSWYFLFGSRLDRFPTLSY